MLTCAHSDEFIVMTGQGKEMAAHFRSTKASLNRLKKEVGTAKAKIEAQKDTLVRFGKKEAAHIALLREKDAAMATKDAQITEQTALLGEYSAEIQAAFDDVSASLETIKALKRENAEVVASNTALTKTHSEVSASMHAVERQLEVEASATKQALERHRNVSEQNSMNETMVERLKLEIAEATSKAPDIAEPDSGGGGDGDGGREEQLLMRVRKV